jgi:plasmid stability protein
VRQLITRIDEDLHRRLKERAAVERRSVNALVTDVLTSAVAGPDTPARVKERARALGLAVVPDMPPDVLSREAALALTRGFGTAVSDALEAERTAR